MTCKVDHNAVENFSHDALIISHHTSKTPNLPKDPAMATIIDISGDGKLTKEVTSEGEGPVPAAGDEIIAHYTGTLLDGTVFDSSRDRGKTFNFVLGEGRVIKGWDQGFATMKKGEKAVLTCAPEYAYGASGSPPKIPPNSTLKFDVELLGFGLESNYLQNTGYTERYEKGDDSSNTYKTANDLSGTSHRGRKYHTPTFGDEASAHPAAFWVPFVVVGLLLSLVLLGFGIALISKRIGQ
jgi:hypothetical protein